MNQSADARDPVAPDPAPDRALDTDDDTEDPATPEPGHSPAAVVVAVLVAVLMGGLIALQSRLNGQLGSAIHNGVVAALISFGSGWILLAIGMVVTRSGRSGLGRVIGEVRGRRIPWWYLAGGAAGAFLVISQGVTAAPLGVALFTVGVVSGQTVSAFVIDRVGLGTLRATPLRASRIVGTVLALVAVVIAVSSNISGDVPVWMLLLPFLAGGGVGWQQAVNGQVRHHSRSALTATFVNFTVGTALLAVASLIAVLVVGAPPPPPAEWWLYAGGPIGVVFIAGAAILVHITGVLLLGLATIGGQLIGSVVLDLALPESGHAVVASTLIGTALALVAVAITALPARRRAS